MASSGFSHSSGSFAAGSGSSSSTSSGSNGLVNRPPSTSSSNPGSNIASGSGHDGWGTYTGGGGGGGGGGSSSGGGSGSSTQTTPAEPEKTPEERQAEFDQSVKDDLAKHWAEAAATTKDIVERADLPPVEIGRVDHIDDAELRDMLSQIVENQKQQSELRTNYAVDKGVNDLERALEDAAQDFQTQRNQVSADEARALDNQALYAESRGDRGGIGQAQYDSIQNTAATNRLKVNQAQTKLSTDTARQIADLRAQGEFEKADALLSITQSYLSELKSLEQWALQTNLSVDEFNIAVDEWEQEFNRNAQQFLINTELSTAQLTGAFANGAPTLAAREQLREQLAATGQIFLDMGLTPTPAQIEAMGLTREQYDAYVAKKNSGGGGGGGGGFGGSSISYHNMWNDPTKPWSTAGAAAAAAAAAGSGSSNSGSNSGTVAALDAAYGAGSGGGSGGSAGGSSSSHLSGKF